MERALLCVPKFSYYKEQYKSIVDEKSPERKKATDTVADDLRKLEKEFIDAAVQMMKISQAF